MSYCTNCMIPMSLDDVSRDHYKSEWHIYNIKRRLLNLQPVDEEAYQKKFLQQQLSQKEVSVSNAVHFCKLCNKSFSSDKTYNQHIQSSKHKDQYKQSLRNLKTPTTETQSDRVSQISKCSLEGPNICLFCDIEFEDVLGCCQHMFNDHGFFIREDDCCIDVEGLLKVLSEQINNNQTCLHCFDSFKTASAVKQHMMDRGHCFMPQQEYKVLSVHYDFENKLQTLIDQQRLLFPLVRTEQKQIKQDEEAIVQEDWQDEESEKDSDEDDQPKTIDEKYKKLKQQLKELQSFKAILNEAGDVQLPSGKILGTRILKKYYKQNHIPFPEDLEDRKIDNTKNEYLSLNNETGQMVFNKEFFTKLLKHQFTNIQRKQQNLQLIIGMRSNQITRKHYRASN